MRRSSVTALLGPRQCGKSKPAQLFALEHRTTYFDLKSQPNRQRLEDPELMRGRLEGLAILDGIREMREPFKALQVLVDRPTNPG